MSVASLGKPVVRRAQDDDLDAITALCLRSKASWGYDDSFMAASRNDLTMSAQRHAAWTTWLAELDGATLLGVAAYSSRDRDAELELLFVEPSYFGRGIGRLLLAHVAGELRARAIDCLWILSDPGAESFYLREGAERVGERPSGVIAGRMLPWLRLKL